MFVLAPTVTFAEESTGFGVSNLEFRVSGETRTKLWSFVEATEVDDGLFDVRVLDNIGSDWAFFRVVADLQYCPFPVVEIRQLTARAVESTTRSP